MGVALLIKGYCLSPLFFFFKSEALPYTKTHLKLFEGSWRVEILLGFLLWTENTKNLLFLLMFSFFSCDFSIKRALLEREKKKKKTHVRNFIKELRDVEISWLLFLWIDNINLLRWWWMVVDDVGCLFLVLPLKLSSGDRCWWLVGLCWNFFKIYFRK